MFDRPSTMSEAERILKERERQLSSQLAAMRAALQRANAGTYGTCTRCGAAIGPERLEYLPETPFCANCN